MKIEPCKPCKTGITKSWELKDTLGDHRTPGDHRTLVDHRTLGDHRTREIIEPMESREACEITETIGDHRIPGDRRTLGEHRTLETQDHGISWNPVRSWIPGRS